MDAATLPLHAGHPGFLLEIAGGVVAGVLVALALFVLVRRLARRSDRSGAAGPDRSR